MQELTRQSLEEKFEYCGNAWELINRSDEYAFYKVNDSYTVFVREFTDGKKHGKAIMKKRKKKFIPENWPDFLEIVPAEYKIFESKEKAEKYFSDSFFNDITDNIPNNEATSELEAYDPAPIADDPEDKIYGEDKTFDPFSPEITLKDMVKPCLKNVEKKLEEVLQRLEKLETNFGKLESLNFIIDHEYELHRLKKPTYT